MASSSVDPPDAHILVMQTDMEYKQDATTALKLTRSDAIRVEKAAP